jgi:hypothetical protein
MAAISRASANAENKNRLRVHKCVIYFQQYPGIMGEDKERGVTEQPDYEISIDGEIAQTGKLKTDGSLEAYIPGGSKASLTVLGTTYELNVLTDIEPHDTLLGAQRRLQLLGYYDAAIDNKWGERTDVATLNFQADDGHDPDGDVTMVYDEIKSALGVE